MEAIDLEKDILSLIEDNKRLNEALNRACQLFETVFTAERIESISKGFVGKKDCSEIYRAMEAFSSRNF